MLSLPGGVFQPYSGVKTSVLFFRKGGRTEHVMFPARRRRRLQARREPRQPVEADDLPALQDAYLQRDERAAQWEARDPAAE